MSPISDPGLDLGLEGMVAVVVGTGPAIGRACVTGLARAGARMACFDRDPEAAKASAEAARAVGVEATSHIVDVLDREAVRAEISAVVSGHGQLDVLVNVVGGARWSLSSQTSEQEWDAVLALNLRQQWVVAQEALRHMIPARAGSIVAVASVSGMNSSTQHGAYGAAKAGLINLIRTLAVENGRHGIRVNAIAPGSIDTPARAGDDALAVKIPLGRRGRPQDIGNAAVFLSSAAASYVNGHVLVVDGGVTANHSLIDLD
jgi:3-oxoacyl-[acyl-carrier protein] reductase